MKGRRFVSRLGNIQKTTMDWLGTELGIAGLILVFFGVLLFCSQNNIPAHFPMLLVGFFLGGAIRRYKDRWTK